MITKIMSNILQIVKWLFFITLAFIIILPIIVLFLYSFKSTDELSQVYEPLIKHGTGYLHIYLLPKYPTLENYLDLLLFSPQFYTVFWNSIKMSFIILIFQLLISTPAAWAFSRFRFKGRKVIFRIYIVLMLLPFQIMMLSQYLVIDALNLMNTQWAIILPAAFSTFPTFIMYERFHAIPKGMIDAARMDGANEYQIFLHIGLPLGMSGIISSVTLGFLEYWNLIEQPMAFLEDKTNWPLSLYLPEITINRVGMLLAATIITLIPAMFVFMIGRNYVEKGIIAASMKE